MGFVDVIRTCFKEYVTFPRRAARSGFWYFVLFLLLGSVVAGLLDGAIFGEAGFQRTTPGAGHGFLTGIHDPGFAIFSLATILPCLAVTWRRMHDTGRRGWCILCLVAIFVAGIVVMAMAMAIAGPGLQALRTTGLVHFGKPAPLPDLIMFALILQPIIWPVVMRTRRSPPRFQQIRSQPFRGDPMMDPSPNGIVHGASLRCGASPGQFARLQARRATGPAH